MPVKIWGPNLVAFRHLTVALGEPGLRWSLIFSPSILADTSSIREMLEDFYVALSVV